MRPILGHLSSQKEALNTDIPVLLERVASEREEMIQQGIPGAAPGRENGKGMGKHRKAWELWMVATSAQKS